MKHAIVTKSKQALKAFVPSKVIQSRLHKRVFMQFAEKIGMVYFGYVDQRNDEHRLVRGLTVSANHRDDHYCIGDFGGYDVMLVERIDTIHFPGKPTRTHDWIIMTFDLHTKADVPHIFLGLHTHSDTFYAHLFTKFAQLVKVPLESSGAYNQAFTNRYAMYTEPAQLAAAQQLFDHEITKTIADHFGSMTVEITDGSLYLYVEHQRPSIPILEKMIKYGAWLAKTIDDRKQEDF
ncbi:MAG: hypothetical protein JWP06_390 [Candidatus Saccharibacteria bacterium]|nr:hypothetical protein [Candidatus Saccharibacteria bacterium]